MIQARITTLRKPAVGVGNRLARAAQSERTTTTTARTTTTTTTTRTLGSLLPHPMGSPTKTTKLLHGNRRSIVPAHGHAHTHTHAHGSTTHSLATAHRRSMVTITQTKSTDAPMVSSPAADDDASSLSTTIAPIYVLNEDSKLNVTQSCLNQVERLLRQRRERAKNHDNNDDNNNDNNDGYFLRVYVDAGGCSGFQYQFEVDNDLDEDEDVVVVMAKIDSDGGLGLPRVVVDETSMGFLEGSTIDYVIEMIKSAFVVADNPQSESACGCGSSFAVKNFEKFGARD